MDQHNGGDETKEKIGDTEEYRKKCEAILEWAEDNDFFNTSFVESVYSQIENGGEITKAQADGVDNIMEGFDIDY